MSRIGKSPVSVPKGVKASVEGGSLKVEGPLGKLEHAIHPAVSVQVDGAAGEIRVSRNGDHRVARAFWGTTRSVLNGMVEGVTKGYEKKLEIIGVGWGARVQGKKLVLTVGFANTIEVGIPDGVKVEVNQTMVTVSGPDKQAVGEFAAKCRAKRKPEPYNGKGIKYSDEVIQRKQGKAFGA